MRILPDLQPFLPERTTRVVVVVLLVFFLGAMALLYVLRERLVSANKSLMKVRDSLVQIGSGSTALSEPSDFTVRLPKSASGLALARQLQNALERGDGQLTSLALSKIEAREQTLGSLNITGVLLGTYGGIKQSFAAALSAEPAVVIQRIAMRRLGAQGDGLEASFDLLVLSRSAPPGGPEPIAQSHP